MRNLTLGVQELYAISQAPPAYRLLLLKKSSKAPLKVIEQVTSEILDCTTDQGAIDLINEIPQVVAVLCKIQEVVEQERRAQDRQAHADADPDADPDAEAQADPGPQQPPPYQEPPRPYADPQHVGESSRVFSPQRLGRISYRSPPTCRPPDRFAANP